MLSHAQMEIIEEGLMMIVTAIPKKGASLHQGETEEPRWSKEEWQQRAKRRFDEHWKPQRWQEPPWEQEWETGHQWTSTTGWDPKKKRKTSVSRKTTWTKSHDDYWDADFGEGHGGMDTNERARRWNRNTPVVAPPSRPFAVPYREPERCWPKSTVLPQNRRSRALRQTT